MRTEALKIYKLTELSEEAQEKAIEDYRVNGLDYDWHEWTIEDCTHLLGLLGIEVTNIFFSGFASQGDGACFTGSFAYLAGCLKAVTEHAPKDEKLHALVEAWVQVQRPAFYRLEGSIKHRGHYYHANCTDIDVWNSEQSRYDEVPQEDEITEVLRDLMRYVYSRLEAEYDYLTSDEAIREAIEANEYEYLENGTQHC